MEILILFVVVAVIAKVMTDRKEEKELVLLWTERRKLRSKGFNIKLHTGEIVKAGLRSEQDPIPVILYGYGGDIHRASATWEEVETSCRTGNPISI